MNDDKTKSYTYTYIYCTFKFWILDDIYKPNQPNKPPPSSFTQNFKDPGATMTL